MPRTARIVLKDLPHHVTQRGNYRQKIFYARKDYERYLDWMRDGIEKYQLSIFAYCLMPNHVHFVAVPKREDSLARAFNVCHMKYAQYIHRRKSLTGHLWQGRFFSCALDEAHLYSAIRYVENNPVRANLVKKPEDWPWSSAGDHMGKRLGALMLEKPLTQQLDVKDWGQYLQQEEEKEVLAIRLHTQRGKPLMKDVFIEALEKKLGVSLRIKRAGRPSKNKT